MFWQKKCPALPEEYEIFLKMYFEVQIAPQAEVYLTINTDKSLSCQALASYHTYKMSYSGSKVIWKLIIRCKVLSCPIDIIALHHKTWVADT